MNQPSKAALKMADAVMLHLRIRGPVDPEIASIIDTAIKPLVEAAGNAAITLVMVPARVEPAEGYLRMLNKEQIKPSIEALYTALAEFKQEGK